MYFPCPERYGLIFFTRLTASVEPGPALLSGIAPILAGLDPERTVQSALTQ